MKQINATNLKPYTVPTQLKVKKPHFNLQRELEGCFMFILLSLSGLVFSLNVLYLKNTPMTIHEKMVEVVDKNNVENLERGGYWSPTLKFKDEKGRVFSKAVEFELYAAKKIGDKFAFKYREYDVTQKKEYLWLYALVPMIVGGLSLFMLLTTFWAIGKTYLSIKHFK